MRLILFILSILLSLGAIEGLAWWWMNPAPTDLGEPVLAYRREVNAEMLKTEMLKEEAPAPAHDSAESFSSIQKSTILNHQSSISPTDNRQPPTDNSPISASQRFSVSASTQTPLPEIYRQAAPMLRCTSGEVFHVQIHDTASLHGAFFEWDGTDTGSVLEAFRHMPEACMGSIGMQLVSKEKPIHYVIRGQEEAAASPSAASSNPQSTIVNPQSSISSSTAHSLLFDHTVFRDPGQGGGPLVPGPLVHAFRAVWVSGTPAADARSGLSGRGFDQLRTIRLNSALSRYRPRHARVIQGAVRGLHTPEAAWAAFEEHMLRHLTFER